MCTFGKWILDDFFFDFWEEDFLMEFDFIFMLLEAVKTKWWLNEWLTRTLWEIWGYLEIDIMQCNALQDFYFGWWLFKFRHQPFYLKTFLQVKAAPSFDRDVFGVFPLFLSLLAWSRIFQCLKINWHASGLASKRRSGRGILNENFKTRWKV